MVTSKSSGSKRTANKAASPETILESAVASIRARGASATTVDQVARKAGCAKGLVHYHFQTRDRLLHAAAQRIAAERVVQWREVFAKGGPSPGEVIEATWDLIERESRAGTVRAWASLCANPGDTVGEAVREGSERFVACLTEELERMFRRSDLTPTIPIEQIGLYVSSVVAGVTLQIAAGLDADDLAEAYAAAWLGVLSLTESRN